MSAIPPRAIRVGLRYRSGRLWVADRIVRPLLVPDAAAVGTTLHVKVPLGSRFLL